MERVINMPRLSILDLEQRIEPIKEARKFLQFLKKEPYFSYDQSFVNVMNKNMNILPFAGTSMSFNDFFLERQIDLDVLEPKYHLSINDWMATQILLNMISFYQTYITWLRAHKDHNREIILQQRQYENNCYWPFVKKIDNLIANTLSLLNYKMEYEEEDNQYGFKTPLIVKRDTDVDSVLPLVDSDIRIDLLSYLDFRVENNLQEKEGILTRLYKTIIDDGKDIYDIKASPDDFKLKYQKELHDRIKLVYNQTNIRHGEQGKIVLTDEEKHKYYDMCFYLLLQLIRTPKSIEDMKKIKDTFAQKQKINP